MKNLHIQHPEDSILCGDLSVLDAFTDRMNNSYSVKIDGSPAIVWGVNPDNGKFFVGTKSVFNKVRPKINYSVEDICKNHKNFELQSILIRCFHCLPRSEEVPFQVFQGDFIGFGGYRDYKPNAISYSFDRVMHGGVVVAPHTYYTGNVFKDMEAKPLSFVLLSGRGADFIQPDAWITDKEALMPVMDIDMMIRFARQMATMVDFVDEKEAIQLKKDLNAYIKDGEEHTLGEVLDQDAHNLPFVQKGMNSPAYRGLWCGEQERRIIHFHQVVDRLIMEGGGQVPNYKE